MGRERPEELSTLSRGDANPERPSAGPPGGHTLSASAARRPCAAAGPGPASGSRARGASSGRGASSLRLGPRPPPPRARAVPAKAGPGGGAHPVLRLQLGQPLLPQRLQLLLRHGAAVRSRAASTTLRRFSRSAPARARPSPLRRRPQRPGITNPARSRAASRSQGAGRGPIVRSQAAGRPAALGRPLRRSEWESHFPVRVGRAADALLQGRDNDRTARGKEEWFTKGPSATSVISSM